MSAIKRCRPSSTKRKLVLGSAGVIVADLKMPRMDGLRLLRHMREKGSEIPIIIHALQLRSRRPDHARYTGNGRWRDTDTPVYG
jgi:CheY-like chemotaxis protein